MCLSAEHLTIGYSGKPLPGRPTAEPLRLQLVPGKLIALLGPNGAGKSTLIRTLAGLQDPVSGTVFVQGRPLSGWSGTALARIIGLVLSENKAAANLRVYEIVALGRTPYTGWLGKMTSHDQAVVAEAMEQARISGLQGRRFHELSDGETQKVMLARVLAQETPVILLDEPLAHLDLLNRIDLLHLLRDLTHHHRKSILFSCHDLDLALQTADTLWLLDMNGEFHAGTPEDLVLSGKIAASYADGARGFDSATGQVRIPAARARGNIRLSGTGTATFWTRHALERSGFTIAATGNFLVEVGYRNDHPEWQLHTTEGTKQISSVGDLLENLLRG